MTNSAPKSDRLRSRSFRTVLLGATAAVVVGGAIGQAMLTSAPAVAANAQSQVGAPGFAFRTSAAEPGA